MGTRLALHLPRIIVVSKDEGGANDVFKLEEAFRVLVQ